MNNISVYEKLQEAKRNHLLAQNQLGKAVREVEEAETKLREALAVGRNVPCKAGLLPDGKVAVHFLASSSESNLFYIVSPLRINYDGSELTKEKNE